MTAALKGDKSYFDKLPPNTDINQQDKSGQTALMIACQKDYSMIVENLLSRGANPNLKDNQLNTALHFAAGRGNLQICLLLLNAKAAITSNISDLSPLHILSKSSLGKLELALELINNGADINQKSKITGETPLLNALSAGNNQLIDLLIANGAKIIDRDKYNVTTYMLAAKSNKLKLLNELSGKGIDVNEKSKTGMTALLYAAMSGNQDVIDFLIKQGADVTAKTNDGETVLGYAVLSKKPAAVQALLDAKADVNTKCIKNYTPLMYAIMNNDNEIIKLLLSHSADVNLYGIDLSSALSIAVSHKNMEVANMLKSNGCRLNLFSEVGFFPVKLGTDRRCDNQMMNIVFDCETNYATSLNLANKLTNSNSDTVKSAENEIIVLMKRSFDEIDKRRSEYSRKIAAKTAKNIGMALLTAAANTASYAAASPGSMYWVNNYNWDSNEFNRAVINNLKNRKDYIENKISEMQTVTPKK